MISKAQQAKASSQSVQPFQLYLNTEFTEQTKVFSFFRALSVQIKNYYLALYLLEKDCVD